MATSQRPHQTTCNSRPYPPDKGVWSTISKSEIQELRSPCALREYVLAFKKSVRRDPAEFTRGLLKAGLYKQFLDELVPLSCFAVLAYPEDWTVRLFVGNQPYDAVAYDAAGDEVDRIELTVPQDGRAEAEDRRLVASRGFGSVAIGHAGDDLAALLPFILRTCRAKARKDYSNCTLVVAIESLTPFGGSESTYTDLVGRLVGEMRAIGFQAKRVYLLLMPDNLIEIRH